MRIGSKIYHWNKNLPLEQKFTNLRKIRNLPLTFFLFQFSGLFILPENIPLNGSPKIVWRDRFRFAQSGAERRFLVLSLRPD